MRLRAEVVELVIVSTQVEVTYISTRLEVTVEISNCVTKSSWPSFNKQSQTAKQL